MNAHLTTTSVVSRAFQVLEEFRDAVERIATTRWIRGLSTGFVVAGAP